MITSDSAIEVRSLHKTYRDGLFGRRRIEALRDVSFLVERGSIFGLLGPNGAGKTTLIKVLLGIVRKTSGDAFMLGRKAGDRQARSQVGYLPENHRIPRHHTGNSAMEYYGRLNGLSHRAIRTKRPQVLDQVGLGEWGRTSIKKYSKGMLQRLGLAQAILHDPELLILDEPTDGVDPIGRSEMRAVLQQLKSQGKMIFINSHLLQEVELVCDRVVILHKGRVQREATMDELTTGSQDEATFTLAGDEATIREALSTAKIGGFDRDSAGGFDVTLQAGNQEELDAAVDSLRKAGVSIAAIHRRRRTLEEAFLDVVQDPRATA